MNTNFPAQRALARAGLYRLLALGFAYPAEPELAEFRRVLTLHIGAEPQAHDLRSTLAQFPEAEPAVLEGEYTRLFDRTVACSPHESDNVGGMRAFTKARDLADVQGFYRAFGMQLGPAATEMGDHIRVELEFMSVLALKEAYFRDGGYDEAAELVIEAQHAFLREHLGRWAPAFGSRLERASCEAFYATVGQATRALLEAEFAALGITPLPIAGTAGEAEEAETLECPLAKAPR
jgi:DMSO reductase family type II enzyme chaperone